MDPIGSQNKIDGSKPNVMNQRKGQFNTWSSNAPKNLGGGFNTSSGTRAADKPRSWGPDGGTVKGKTKHTYRG